MEISLIAYFMCLDGNVFLREKGIALITGETNLLELEKMPAVYDFIQNLKVKNKYRKLEYDRTAYLNFAFEYTFA